MSRRRRAPPPVGRAGRVVVGGWLVATGVLLVGAGFGALARGAAAFTGDGEVDLLWMRLAEVAGSSTVGLRLAVAGGAQAVCALALSPWAWRVVVALGDRLDALAGRPGRAARVGLALAGLAVFGPVGFQHARVGGSLGAAAWAERLAGALDGTASGLALDAWVGPWRAVSPGAPGRWAVATLDGGLDGPAMTRWDRLIRAETRDPEHYAQTRAFLWVESGGRQYAISRTGCAGLMQFCVSTAQRRPFAGIFGAGGVSPCRCDGPCAVPAELARALETEPDAAFRRRRELACDPSDARFDPERAIRAGAAFTAELSVSLGGNLELMYVGYNSGPAVARRIWKAAGSDPTLDLAGLRPLLAPALRPWYGAAADGRAQGLLDVHLPKLRQAFEHARRAVPPRE